MCLKLNELNFIIVILAVQTHNCSKCEIIKMFIMFGFYLIWMLPLNQELNKKKKIQGSCGLMDRALDLEPEVVGSSLGSSRKCQWGEWITSVLSTFNTRTEVRPLSKAPNPQLLPGRRSIGCPLLRVCVHYCVCALGWLNAEHKFQATCGHTSLQNYYYNFFLIKQCSQEDV